MSALASYQPLIGSHLNVPGKENNDACSLINTYSTISKYFPDIFRLRGGKGDYNQRKQHLKTSQHSKCNILKISSLIDLDTNI
ncbi:hypothetical protein SAMN04488101_107143 [Pedobacter nyackensis]|uniref:Uncharacterized protein n=1 Tax=Pedobacter nyackensis TaxID=475255 RepID=A0A1W2DL32_9SPHI|nr:hypothetical protein SAMN04488101_107143 [Pedobacter nyackensis]